MIPTAKRYLLPYVSLQDYYSWEAFGRYDLAGGVYSEHHVWYHSGYHGWRLVFNNSDVHIDTISTRDLAMVALDKLLVDNGYALIKTEDADKYRLLL